MKLYNTHSRRIEDFVVRDQEVKIYICGITPYDTTHLGHAFTYTSGDILIRYLELQGYRVKYVQNVTDIDDDIIKKSRQVGKDWRTLGNEWTNHFIRDMQNLNVRPPDYYPGATEFIPGIVSFVEKLVQAGKAYVSGGNVYYSVGSFPQFGQLSHLPKDEMLPIANERGNFPDDPKKHDPLDFVLWQAKAPGEPAWDSPWGPGRPGWHIECSTMSTQLLGEVVDVHGGGEDLCFPHHECEIAQVLPVTGEPVFVRYWMHNAMVRYQGEKMSKSLGNLVMVSDLLKTYTPDALRLYLACYHYRDSWSYEEPDLQRCAAQSDNLRRAVELKSSSGPELDVSNIEAEFRAALDNDLDTPTAVQSLSKLADGILHSVGHDLRTAQEILRRLAGVLGLRLDEPAAEPRVSEGWERFIR